MKLAAVGLVVEDIQRSITFYRILGLDFQSHGTGEHYEAVTENGLRVMLDSTALKLSLEPDWKKPNSCAVSLCFEQPTAADVNELYSALCSAGASTKKAPWDAFWGQRYAVLLDPDGNQIDLFATLPT